MLKDTLTTYWAIIEKIGFSGVQFIIGIILARLLSPSDYGVIALLLFFITIGQQFIDCGFGNALIRKDCCNSKEFNTAFYFNVIVGLVCYIVLYIVSPLISKFYDTPELCSILRVYGLSLIINSLSIVHVVILTRNLEFKEMATCRIISSIIAGCIAIVYAYLRPGPWALVLQTLSSAIIYVFFIQKSTKWYPKNEFDIVSLKYMWSFGSRLLISGLLSTLYSNIYTLIIGKVYTKEDLGNFNRGNSLAVFLPSVIESGFNKSSLPLLSQYQNDSDYLVYFYKKQVRLIAYLSFPVSLFMYSLSEPFVQFFLTEKWINAVFYIKLFSIASLVGPIGIININLLLAIGRSDEVLKADIIKKAIGIMAVALSINSGVKVLALVSVIVNIFIYFINLYFVKRNINIKITDQLNDIIPLLLVATISCIVCYVVFIIVKQPLIQLIVGAILGCITYVCLTKYVLRVNYYDSLITIIRSRLK